MRTGKDGLIRLWDLENETVIFTFGYSTFRRISCITCCDISPYSTKIVTGCGDGSIKVSFQPFVVHLRVEFWFDRFPFFPILPHDKFKRSYYGPFPCIFFSVWSPSRPLIWFTQIWDGIKGKLIYSLTGHKLAVKDIKISKDGKSVISSSRDHTIRMWDTSELFM